MPHSHTHTHTHTYTSNANVRSRIPAQVLAHIRGTCISYVRIGSLQERVIFVYISDEYDLLSSVSFQDINFWRGQNVRPDSEGGRIQLLHVGMIWPNPNTFAQVFNKSMNVLDF